MDREKRVKKEPEILRPEVVIKGDTEGTHKAIGVRGRRKRKVKRNKNHVYWANLTAISEAAKMTRGQVVRTLIKLELLRSDGRIPTHAGIDFRYARFAYGKYEWDKQKTLEVIRQYHK